MPDWTESMQQTFEYYEVDPQTWGDKKRIENILSSSIDWDEEQETLGSATIDVSEELSECYIRIYLITIQNGIRERHALGTFMVQSPSFDYDGKSRTISLDAYTPLIELKEKMPPIGYSLRKGEPVMENAYAICRENLRAPVSEPSSEKALLCDFVADPNEYWLSFLGSLISAANYKFDLDEMGCVLFAPIPDIASLQPVWTYTDDNSSILYPEVSVQRDLYGIPNVVEIIYSADPENCYLRVVNDDKNSPISTVNRGREIVYRVTDPEMSGKADGDYLRDYAVSLLRNLSTLEYTLTYKHGYCPVRVGDCVRLSYERAGIDNVKAKVVRQSISCEPGCPVSETAVYTKQMWNGR